MITDPGRVHDDPKGHVLRKHGLSKAEYAAKKDSQGGRCAICGTVTEYPLYVDHDHRCCGVTVKKYCTRCTRSLLCAKCNSGLGMFHDDPDLLKIAVAYLESWRQ